MKTQSRELEMVAERIQSGLAQLGLCHEIKKAGLTVAVSFRRLELVDQGDGAPAAFGLCEIDMLTLPRRVTAVKLTKADVLHHLTAVVGKPVYHCNSLGLTYIVDLRPPATRHKTHKLPKRVDLDLAGVPAGGYQVPIGVGASGAIWRSLTDLGHVLLGGATRTGKSVWLQSALAALLTANEPKELQLALCDPKAVEFSLWTGVPHLLCPIAVDVSEADQVTGALVAEMDRRQGLFASAFARNLTAYNVHADEPLPVVLFVCDEIADITLGLGKSSQAYVDLSRLVAKGQGLGVFVWAATQNPKAEVLGTLARGQFLTRLAFRMNESVQSRVILETSGAESLPNVKGRMLARLPDVAHLVLAQGYNLDDDELLSVARGLATGAGACWVEKRPEQDDIADRVLAAFDETGTKSGASRAVFGSAGGNDYYKTVDILKTHGKV